MAIFYLPPAQSSSAVTAICVSFTAATSSSAGASHLPPCESHPRTRPRHPAASCFKQSTGPLVTSRRSETPGLRSGAAAPEHENRRRLGVHFGQQKEPPGFDAILGKTTPPRATDSQPVPRPDPEPRPAPQPARRAGPRPAARSDAFPSGAARGWYLRVVAGIGQWGGDGIP